MLKSEKILISAISVLLMIIANFTWAINSPTKEIQETPKEAATPQQKEAVGESTVTLIVSNPPPVVSAVPPSAAPAGLLAAMMNVLFSGTGRALLAIIAVIVGLSYGIFCFSKKFKIVKK